MIAASDEEPLRHYRTLRRRRRIAIGLLALGVALAFVADLLTGPSGLDAGQVLAALTGRGEVSRTVEVIVWQVRLPASAMALLVGAALSLAGAELQAILDNPLAEPFTLGISSSAALGAAVAIVLGLSFPMVSAAWAVSANAFVFALASLGAIYHLTRRRGTQVSSLVLFGIALGFTSGALLSLLQFLASADALQQLVFWSMGSLSRADGSGVLALGAVLALCVPFSLASAWRLTALRLGEEKARSLGIDLQRLRLGSLLRIGLLAATAVAFVGIVGFVGLVGPHIARMLVGEDHRLLLPASLAVGSLVMLLASIASKLILPGVTVPIGIVTALVGLPIFFALILRRDEGTA